MHVWSRGLDCDATRCLVTNALPTSIRIRKPTASMPSVKEEATFMNDLLSGIDFDSLSDYVPSPAGSPVRSTLSTKRPRSPTKSKTRPTTPAKLRLTPGRSSSSASRTPIKAERGDLENLLEGADNWDWDDWGTPKKKTPIKVENVRATSLSCHQVYLHSTGRILHRLFNDSNDTLHPMHRSRCRSGSQRGTLAEGMFGFFSMRYLLDGSTESGIIPLPGARCGWVQDNPIHSSRAIGVDFSRTSLIWTKRSTKFDLMNSCLLLLLHCRLSLCALSPLGTFVQ
jgi:hypothetical protein